MAINKKPKLSKSALNEKVSVVEKELTPAEYIESVSDSTDETVQRVFEILNNMENGEEYRSVTNYLASLFNATIGNDLRIESNDLGDIRTIAAVYCLLKASESPENVRLVWDMHFRDSISTWECYSCNEGMLENDERTIVEGNGYCQTCFDNHANCERCGVFGHIDQIMSYIDAWSDYDASIDDDSAELEYSVNAYYCDDCRRHVVESLANSEVNAERAREREEIRLRSIANQNYPIRGQSFSLVRYASDTLGDTVASTRVWSCEIEHYSTDRQKAVEVYNAMPTGFGLSGDGSLSTKGKLKDGRYIDCPIEIQTSLLGGFKGEDVIRAFCKKLQKAGSYVDSTCGLHIHIDMEDILKREDKVRVLKNVLLFHILFEDVVMLFLPSMRRNAHYCQSIGAKYTRAQMANIRSMEGLMTMWYNTSTADEAFAQVQRHYQSTRYTGVNFHPLWEKNNIEIRHHSGTLNAQKILEWVNLHLSIVDYCVNESVSIDSLQEVAAAMKDKSSDDRMRAIFDMLDLSNDSREYLASRAAKFANGEFYEGDMSIPDKKKTLLPEANLNEVDLCVG